MASPSFESTYHHFYTTSTSNLLLRNFPAAYDNAQSLLLLCSKSSLQSDELQTVWERWASVREEQIKAVKLNITVLTSIYIDAITNIGRPSLNQAGKAENYSVVLSELLSRLIKGSLNKEKVGSLVNHLVTSTTSSLNPSTPSASSISQSPHLSALSPPLLETLLLSLLKLSSSLPSTIASRKPKSSSSKTLEADFLERGRTLFEDWLAQIQSDLSDEDLDALYHPRRHHESESLSSSTASHPSSSASSHPVSSPSPTATVLSKAYKSSLRLYVLEFLPRLGEWELAREIVCGGLVRGAGEKERILKKLHSMETKAKQHSLSSSQLQSKPADTPAAEQRSGKKNAVERAAGGGSRRSSMSDETERTVRPIDFLKPVSGAAGSGGRQTAAATGSRETLQPTTAAGKGSSRKSDISATSSNRVRAQARIFERKAKAERKEGDFRRMKIDSRRSSSSSAVTSGDESEGSSLIEIRRSVDLDEEGSSEGEDSLDGASTTMEKAEEGDEAPGTSPPRTREQGGQFSPPGPSSPPSRLPVKRTAFEALRNRITRYLDEPIARNSGSGTSSPTQPGRPRTVSISRHNLPLHLRISQNPIFRILTRSLAVLSIIFFILGLLRQNRRRRLRKRGQAIGDESVWVEVGREMWRSVWVALDKIRDFGKMGTTITYV